MHHIHVSHKHSSPPDVLLALKAAFKYEHQIILAERGVDHFPQLSHTLQKTVVKCSFMARAERSVYDTYVLVLLYNISSSIHTHTDVW